MYYSSFGMLSLVIHIIINIRALGKPQESSRYNARQTYRSFLFGVMLYYISDILWGILYGAKYIIPTYIDTVIYFSSMVLSMLLWTRFIVAYLDNKGHFGRILIYGGWIIFCYEMLVLVINFFIPIVFTFKDKEYIPGQARYITLFIQMFLFLMTSGYTFAKAFSIKDADKSRHITVGISGLIMTVFIALQSLYPLLPFYAVGCLLATCMIHSFVYRDETREYANKLESNKQMAYRDALTGVKNKNAYVEAVMSIDNRVQTGELQQFGVVVFDVNGLKRVNDTLGHDAGDEYIRSACRMICVMFKHSPVFRIGGDEFVVILEGDDYENRTYLHTTFDQDVEENQRRGLVVVSCGMDIYDSQEDSEFNDVFKRADKNMYKRKEFLKKMN